MNMNKFKKSFLFTLFFVMLFSTSASAIPNPFAPQNKTVYYGNTFNAQSNNLNLIINALNQTNNGLILDGYLYNNTNRNFSEITSFIVEIRDGNGNVFARKEFFNIPLDGGLAPLQGKRISLTFDKNSYNLSGKDLSNLTWNYKYNFK